MASRRPTSGAPDPFADFTRAVDELFDDLLIARWREPRTRAGHGASVIDRGTDYAVQLAVVGHDPNAVEIEVSERRLIVRIPGPTGFAERSFDFAHPIECDGVSARWRDGALLIVLPKKPGRRVAVE
ncbi:MAG TPA: Hsp20/alpha crystallin family protein [Candidatus Binataceae bacterium]|nr:Hsp20/alpha crystallin family protein [Candidatus Binataceae bacterium]